MVKLLCNWKIIVWCELFFLPTQTGCYLRSHGFFIWFYSKRFPITRNDTKTIDLCDAIQNHSNQFHSAINTFESVFEMMQTIPKRCELWQNNNFQIELFSTQFQLDTEFKKKMRRLNVTNAPVGNQFRPGIHVTT